MCTELTLTDQQRKAAQKLRLAGDYGSPLWLERVAKAVDGMGGPLAEEFCNMAGA